MPKIIMKQVTLYTFAELVELEKVGVLKTACQKAREWLQESQTDHDWWDYTYDTWKGALAQIGFDDAEISFSGFWSQCDGASFTCKCVDTEKLIEFILSDVLPDKAISYDGKDEDFSGWLTHKIGNKPSINAKLDRLIGKVTAVVARISNRYSHENTCRLSVGYDDCEFFESTSNVRLLYELETLCERLRVDICHAIYKDLQEEHEWLMDDKQLLDTAEANKWLFNENGDMESE